MDSKQVAPYGSWRSPVSAAQIAEASIRLLEMATDGPDVYWIESRPAEQGRNVVVRRAPDGTLTDVTPPPFNARTRVHEYGGGAFCVAGGTVYFSNFSDGRLYRQQAGGAPEPLTPAEPLRYADMVLDERRNRLISVREDHRDAGHEAVNTLVSLPLDEVDGGQILVEGHDFYSSPRLSPDGARLAWLAWNHPNMPWDGTELWVAEIDAEGMLGERALVAGGVDESIFQPEWSPDGVLHFISDRSGWWNLYRWRDRQVGALAAREVEFGQPQWVFGQSVYGFASAERLICTFDEPDGARLASLDLATLALEPLDVPYSVIQEVRVTPRKHRAARRLAHCALLHPAARRGGRAGGGAAPHAGTARSTPPQCPSRRPSSFRPRAG